jgi:zinc transport system substrate-binding protein
VLATIAALVAGVVAALAPRAAETDPPLVAVSILPQQEFVHRVAGDSVQLEVLVQPGQSPHTYEPTPRQAANLAEAALWIRIGVPFEDTVLRKLVDVAPGLAIVDGCRGIDLAPIDEREAGSLHHHGRLDPHFWLDPQLVSVHVGTVREALCAVVPERCPELDANLAGYRADLAEVDHRVAAILAPFAGRELLVFHPAYGYFARRYGLRQRAVEVDGKEPTGRQLAELIDRARESGANALFVQPQLSGSSARAAAQALGVPLVQLDPMAPDYLSNIERMAEHIAASFGG